MQEGFLLGDVIYNETKKVTDSDHQVLNKEQIIKINSIIPCPQQFYFYDAAGKVDANKIKRLLGEQYTNLMGWYSFKQRHLTPPRLTFREKIIHKQLLELASLPKSCFSYCLLTTENSNTKATYSLNQTFIRYWLSKYEHLSLHINNLSDSSYLFKSPEPALSNLLNKIVKVAQHPGDGDVIQRIQENLKSYMKSSIQELVEQDAQLFRLEQRIKELKENKKCVIKRHSMDVKEATSDVVLPREASECTKAKRGRPRKAPSQKEVNKFSENNENSFQSKINTRSRGVRNYSEALQKKTV